MGNVIFVVRCLFFCFNLYTDVHKGVYYGVLEAATTYDFYPGESDQRGAETQPLRVDYCDGLYYPVLLILVRNPHEILEGIATLSLFVFLILSLRCSGS